MKDIICRAWVIPENRMTKEDLDFTFACIKYMKKGGNKTEIGFLNDAEGTVFDVQLYSNKKDMNNETICDGDIIYSPDMGEACRVVFDGCAFIVLNRFDHKVAYLSDLPSDRIVINGNKYEGIRK